MKKNTNIVINEMNSTSKVSDGLTDWTMGKTFKGESSVNAFAENRKPKRKVDQTRSVSRNSIVELPDVSDLRQEIIRNEPLA